MADHLRLFDRKFLETAEDVGVECSDTVCVKHGCLEVTYDKVIDGWDVFVNVHVKYDGRRRAWFTDLQPTSEIREFFRTAIKMSKDSDRTANKQWSGSVGSHLASILNAAGVK